jgi:uncharacterized membrane protein
MEDSEAYVVTVVTFASTGVLFSILALPLMRNKVTPNKTYGFRTPATLSDEALWYEVNSKAGKDLLVIGLGLLAILAAMTLIGSNLMMLVVGCIAWLAVGSIIMVIRGFATIRRWQQTRS